MRIAHRIFCLYAGGIYSGGVQNRILLYSSPYIFTAKHAEKYEGRHLEKIVHGSSDFGFCGTFCFVFKDGIQCGYTLVAVFELDI